MHLKKWCKLSTPKTCLSWNYSRNNKHYIMNLAQNSTVLIAAQLVWSKETLKIKCPGTHSSAGKIGLVIAPASNRNLATLPIMWRYFNGQESLWSHKWLIGTDNFKVLLNKLPSTIWNKKSMEKEKNKPKQRIWLKTLEKPSSDTSTRTEKLDWKF